MTVMLLLLLLLHLVTSNRPITIETAGWHALGSRRADQNLVSLRFRGEESRKPSIVVDPAEWAVECERVSSRLRVAPKSDPKEWRMHLQQAIKFKHMMHHYLPSTKSSLDQNAADISQAMEKISSKEAWLQQQYEQVTCEHNSIGALLKEKKQESAKLSETLATHQAKSLHLNEQLQSLRRQMADQAARVTDTSLLIALKDQLVHLQKEIRQMELRIGVAAHTLMQAKLHRTTRRDNKENTRNEPTILDGQDQTLHDN